MLAVTAIMLVKAWPRRSQCGDVVPKEQRCKLGCRAGEHVHDLRPSRGRNGEGLEQHVGRLDDGTSADAQQEGAHEGLQEVVLAWRCRRRLGLVCRRSRRIANDALAVGAGDKQA